MSSTPIRNGVTVRLPEYGNRFLRADIYRITDAYVFVGTVFYYEGTEVTVDVEVVLKGNTIERESRGYTLLVVPAGNCNFLNKEVVGHGST